MKIVSKSFNAIPFWRCKHSDLGVFLLSASFHFDDVNRLALRSLYLSSVLVFYTNPFEVPIMKKWIRVAAAVALVASSVTLADRAEGKDVRNPIERRTNPEDGFFVKNSSSSHVSKSQVTSSPGRFL